MGGDDGDNNVTEGTIKPNEEERSIDNAIPTNDGAEAVVTATAAPTTDEQDSAPGETTSGASLTRAQGVKRTSVGEFAAANDTVSVGQGVDSIKAMDPQNNGDTVNVAEVAAKGQADDETECNGPDQGDDVYDNGEDDDDLSSSVEGGKESNGWNEVEAGERTGYSGADVEPFAVQERIDGSCVMQVCGTD